MISNANKIQRVLLNECKKGADYAEDRASFIRNQFIGRDIKKLKKYIYSVQ
jgi:hypothetical protein